MSYYPALLKKVFGAPMRYYQGPGILATLTPKLIKGWGFKKPLIFSGKRTKAALERVGFFKALEAEGIKYRFEGFGEGQPWGPECCDEEIERLAKIGSQEGCDVVIAAGGGKALDTGKDVANKMGVDVFIVPTIAAQDAPTSALSVVYTAEHVFKRYDFFDRHPLAVIVDSKVIAEAPARFLACGIGDAFSKFFEVYDCYRSGANNCVVKPEPGYTTLTAANLSKLLYETLRTWGVEAMDSVEMNAVTPPLEAIIEANILLSGLAFESGGLSVAHAVYDGLTVVEEKMHPYQFHGELVHFGTCTQVVLEGYPKDIIFEVFKFGHEVGLPETFEEIGLKGISDEDLWKVAEATAKDPMIKNVFYEIDAEKVFFAMKGADAIGRRISKIVPRRPYELVKPSIPVPH